MTFNEFIFSNHEIKGNILIQGKFGKGVVNLTKHQMIPYVNWKSYYYPGNDGEEEIREIDEDYDGEETYLRAVPNNNRFPTPVVLVYEKDSRFDGVREHSLNYINNLLNDIGLDESLFDDEFSEDCYGTIKDIQLFLVNNKNSLLLSPISQLQKTEELVNIEDAAINCLGYSKTSLFGINIGDFCIYKDTLNYNYEKFGKIIDINFSVYDTQKDSGYPDIVIKQPDNTVYTISLEDIINKTVLFQTFKINTNKCSIIGSQASYTYFKNQDLKRTLHQACASHFITNSSKFNINNYSFKILQYNSERLFYDCKLSVVNNCAYDGSTQDVVEVSYAENLTTKFLLCDVEFEYIPIPLNIKYINKRKKIQVKQGVSLVLKKNKNFPSLPINKEYKIEVYIPSKVSKDTFYNKNRVVITHNEKTLIVPLSYFKIPYVNSNTQNNKLEKAEVII